MSIDAEKRVTKEWKGQLIFYIYSPYRKFTERMIHLLLNYCRVEINLIDSTKQIEWFYMSKS